MAEKETARQIIERRVGRKWPATRDLAPDQRQAIKLLAIQLIKKSAARARERKDKPND
jgi:hypothetical protein